MKKSFQFLALLLSFGFLFSAQAAYAQEKTEGPISDQPLGLEEGKVFDPLNPLGLPDQKKIGPETLEESINIEPVQSSDEEGDSMPSKIITPMDSVIEPKKRDESIKIEPVQSSDEEGDAVIVEESKIMKYFWENFHKGLKPKSVPYEPPR